MDDRHLSHDLPGAARADDALDPVHELDDVEPALDHGEQRTLLALVQRILAGHEADVGGQPREALAIGRIPLEEGDPADLLRGHHRGRLLPRSSFSVTWA